jgi:ACS family tartrate transporter-like MFS transporter
MTESTAPAAVAAGVAAADDAERRVFGRIAWRLMPLLIVSYVLNYLDRTNISFAALQMNEDVRLTPTEFGVGAGVFFLGYCLFEVPSNVVLYRVGARVWIARIMISWGFVSAAMMFVAGPVSFYVLRFLLGVAEAGFFPGVAFYLATWFPVEYRTRIVAWFMLAIPVSAVIGGPVSGLLLGMHGVLGIAGWQWLFLVEGLPVVLLGLVVLQVLADTPETAGWLTEEERRIVRRRLDAERRPKEVKRLGSAIRDIRVLMLAAIQFGFLVGSYGIGLWLPQMLQAGKLSDLRIGFVTSACYAVASAGMIAWASYVDRTGSSKVTNLAIACVLAAAGLLGAIAAAGQFWVSIAWLAVALLGVNGARAIFWSIPPRFLSGMAAAGGLAFINSIGVLGGFVGPTIMGWLTDQTGSYSAGLLALSGFLVASAVIAWLLKRFAAGE